MWFKVFFSILYFTLRYNVHLEIFNRSINNSSNIILIISPYFIELQIGQKQKGRQWVYEAPIFEVIFVTLTENSLVVTNDTQGPPEIVDMALHYPSIFTNQWGRFLLLLPSLVSLLSGGTVQLENIYSCILKATGQVWESQKSKSINTNYSYHQHYLPQPVSTDQTIISDSVLTNSVGKDGVQGWSI